MQIEILTLFPDVLPHAARGKPSRESDRVGDRRMTVTDLRSFAEGRHRKVDDEPYGGGAGMVMMAPVLAAAIEARREPRGPAAGVDGAAHPGRRASRSARSRGARRPRAAPARLRPVRGDRRAVPGQLGLFDQEISLGDFVLPGGEAAALAVTEAVPASSRESSARRSRSRAESFARERLDYPHYTRPREYRGLVVPDALLSGDHARIRRWRRARALERDPRAPARSPRKPPGRAGRRGRLVRADSPAPVTAPRGFCIIRRFPLDRA